MRFSSSEIIPIAESTGFRVEMIEKVLHLLNLLNTLNSHPFLKGKWALKGGTALNLFLFNLPRLSVDIDLNYVGALNREEMLADRPKIEQAAQAVFSREGFTARKAPDEHAGRMWRLRYLSYTGQSGNLEVDFNFMFRQPLWEICYADSQSLGDFQAKNIPVIDLHELAAGKIAALLARHQPRDLFDTHRLLDGPDLDRERLRVAFVVYGAMNRKDWRTVNVKDVHFKPGELQNHLIPLLRRDSVPTGSQAVTWGDRLVKECRQRMDVVLPLSKPERKFLDLLLDTGQIDASLLTADTGLAERIKHHPLLEWKAMNVRQYKQL